MGRQAPGASFCFRLQHAEVELAQNEEVDPVAEGIAANLEVFLSVKVGLSAAGMDAILGDDGAVPGLAGARTEAGCVEISQWQILLGGNVSDDCINRLHRFVVTAPRRNGVEDRHTICLEAFLDDDLQSCTVTGG